MTEGRLIICGTPIGNLGDVSERLSGSLRDADVVYAEDTRRASTLLRHVGAEVKVRSLFVGNERARTSELLDDVRSGRVVALVSDAGMPSVSDPGADAAAMALAEGLSVTVIPGPSAVTAAISVSGFGGDRFVFEGFLPRKGNLREARLEDLAGEPRVIVLFSSPKRVGADLKDLGDYLGVNRHVAVIKELTKIHEKVWVGTLIDAAGEWGGDQKGEFTLVVGPGEADQVSMGDAVDLARRRIEAGMSVGDAARDASAQTGVSRRAIYEELIRS